SLNKIGGVPDVVEPSRRYESVGQRQLLGDPPSPPRNRPHMSPAEGQRSRQLGLGKLHRPADVDHSLDFTHGSPVGQVMFTAACRLTLDQIYRQTNTAIRSWRCRSETPVPAATCASGRRSVHGEVPGEVPIVGVPKILDIASRRCEPGSASLVVFE